MPSPKSTTTFCTGLPPCVLPGVTEKTTGKPDNRIGRRQADADGRQIDDGDRRESFLAGHDALTMDCRLVVSVVRASPFASVGAAVRAEHAVVGGEHHRRAGQAVAGGITDDGNDRHRAARLRNCGRLQADGDGLRCGAADEKFNFGRPRRARKRPDFGRARLRAGLKVARAMPPSVRASAGSIVPKDEVKVTVVPL